METTLTPENTKISLELPTKLLVKTRGIADDKMCSLSAIVRQSLKELVENNRD